MSNAWNVTENEYREALERSRDGSTSPEDSAAYWQLCRFYRGQVFLRDEAARAVRLIRQCKPKGQSLAHQIVEGLHTES